MKKMELMEFASRLRSAQSLKGLRVAYAVVKNLKNAEREIGNIYAMHKKLPEFENYDKKRIELCKKHAKKNPANGEPVLRYIPNKGTTGSQAQFDIENFDEFNKEFAILRDMHKPEIEAQEKVDNEFNEWVQNTDAELVIHKIKVEDLPQDISAEQLDSISPIVENL